jgi:hypothetical protein
MDAFWHLDVFLLFFFFNCATHASRDADAHHPQLSTPLLTHFFGVTEIEK